MILVVTGFHSQPFDRLVRAMDDIARTSDEEVVIQKGASNIVTEYARAFSYESEGAMTDYFQKARLVVCHAGVGTIIEARKHRKPVIVVPRRFEHSEHLDNHQLEIAEAAERTGAVMRVDDVQELAAAVEATKSVSFVQKENTKLGLIEYLRKVIADVEAGR